MVKEVAFQKACTEVYEILKFTNKEDVNMISQDFRQLIKDNMDKNYEFIYNPNIEFEQQEIMRETKVLLGYIFMNFWATEKQQDIINKKFKDDLKEEEEEKRKKYNK